MKLWFAALLSCGFYCLWFMLCFWLFGYPMGYIPGVLGSTTLVWAGNRE